MISTEHHLSALEIRILDNYVVKLKLFNEDGAITKLRYQCQISRCQMELRETTFAGEFDR